MKMNILIGLKIIEHIISQNWPLPIQEQDQVQYQVQDQVQF